MWNGLWRTLGRGARAARKSAVPSAGPVGAAIAVGELALPARSLGGTTGRSLRELIRAGSVAALMMPRVGRATARMLGSASAGLERRAVMVGAGTRASLRALGRLLAAGGRSSSSLRSAEAQAEKIAQILEQRGVNPERIGIDGLPGSGKSTLARALAKRLGMRRRSLDYKNLHNAENLASGRTVYEHHRLLRTQDVDAFDAIVYIDMSAGRSRARVCRRGRGLFLAAVLNYGRLRKIGKLAFEVCEGEPIRIADSPLFLKIRPPGGFRALENTISRLAAARPPGAAGPDASRTSREEMLFILASGKQRHGLSAYLVPLDCVSRFGKLCAALHSAGRSFVKAWRAQSQAVQRAQDAPDG